MQQAEVLNVLKDESSEHEVSGNILKLLSIV